MGTILEGKGIYKGFGGLQALSNVNVKIEEKKITGLIGPNGAGKTTLFNILSGFIKPEKGKILFKDKEITREKPHDVVLLGLARSWQGLRLFENLTVLENIVMSLPTYKSENVAKIIFVPWSKNKAKLTRAMEILDLITIKDRAFTLIRDLSFAEQKLVAVARLLATDSEVLLLDEPVSGLDEKTVEKVVTPLLRELVMKNGKTICLVEHSIKLVFNMCDTVYCLNQGEIVAAGEPRQLSQDEKLKRAFFQIV